MIADSVAPLVFLLMVPEGWLPTWSPLDTLHLHFRWGVFTPLGVAVIAVIAWWRWRRRFSQWRNRRRRIFAVWRRDCPGTFVAAFNRRLQARPGSRGQRYRRRRYDYYRFYLRMTRNL
jgi:hypothetical protein